MKRHSTCNRCGCKGHWARECRARDVKKGAGKGDKGATSTGSTSGAAVVEDFDFVAMVTPVPYIEQCIEQVDVLTTVDYIEQVDTTVDYIEQVGTLTTGDYIEQVVAQVASVGTTLTLLERARLQFAWKSPVGDTPDASSVLLVFWTQAAVEPLWDSPLSGVSSSSGASGAGLYLNACRRFISSSLEMGLSRHRNSRSRCRWCWLESGV